MRWEKAVCRSIISSARRSSPPPAASTKSPSTACTPPPNPLLTENSQQPSAPPMHFLAASASQRFVSLLFVNDPSANDRGRRRPFECPPIERGITRLARRFFHMVSPGLIHRKNCPSPCLPPTYLSPNPQPTPRPPHH